MRHNSAAQSPQSPLGGRFKYANPQDLPSSPSVGLKKSDSAASAAASLGWANQQSFSIRPEHARKASNSISASASTAALLAHDAKMPASVPPPSQPAQPNVSLKAATLAAGAQSISLASTPQKSSLVSSVEPSSSNAAEKAVKSERISAKFSPRSIQTAGLDRRGSLRAANGAMSSSFQGRETARPRAVSSPLTATSSSSDLKRSAAASALSAAKMAHRPSMRSPVVTEDVGAIPYTTLPRSMFTSLPPVKYEAGRQDTSEKIHVDALAMARKMYTQQQAILDSTKQSEIEDGINFPNYGSMSLQDTAFKRAQRVLSQIDADAQRSREYQYYYGAGSPSTSHRRFSSRSVLRRRSSSDSDILMRDHRQTQKIRRQMSIFNNKLNEVDEKKRTQDRESLLARAQKNVQAQLAGIDQQISIETGWVPSSTRTEWDSKTQAPTRQHSDERTETMRRGQVNIGGGKYMDIKDVEAIASKRMRPEIDRIYAKADKEREHIEKEKSEQEAKKKEAEEKKAREKEQKEALKEKKAREKQAEKERKDKERQRERARKEKEKKEQEKEKQEERERREQNKEKEQHRKGDEKTARQQQHQQTKEERRHRNELAAAAKALKKQQESQNTGPRESDVDDKSSLSSSRPSTALSLHSRGPSHPTEDVSSPRSSHGKVKTWLKTRFTRSRGQSNVSAITTREEGEGTADISVPFTQENVSSFVGGAALRQSCQSFSCQDNDSIRDVALAGREEQPSLQRVCTNDLIREDESEIPLDLLEEQRPVSPLNSSSIGDISSEEADSDIFHDANSDKEGEEPQSYDLEKTLSRDAMKTVQNERVESIGSGLFPPSARPLASNMGAGSGGSGNLYQHSLASKNRTGSRGSGSLHRDSRFQEMMDGL